MGKLLLLYRLLLFVNTGISGFFLFDSSIKMAQPSTFSERAYQIQILLLVVMLCLFVAGTIMKKALSSRVLWGIAYVVLSFWTTEIIFHWWHYPEFWQSSLVQTVFFIAEVLVFAVLCKNDFEKNFLL
ncbi:MULTISPECIES: hypothetical protein [Enterococcus]|uniref:hypothetical protein n=1 Tax=Enterococcus TaxID=1350 RepID=UPI00065DD05C|nr:MULTISPECIES: hypothetical protein [Enterococcus]KAF1300904.1 hypothetical protein BAU16_11020 [Enterococcus sp. JM9B]